MKINVEILECPHGIPKTQSCEKCRTEKYDQAKSYIFQREFTKPKKVPIFRGCVAASMGGCFCTGHCKEIIGYRDPIPGEII